MIETYAETGQVRFEYKHFAFLGAESQAAAEASECAREQGQFWQYHDVLFENQRGENAGAYRRQALEAFAAALGLDEAVFNDCLASDRYEDLVEAERAEGQERGVRSTPTLFVNGEMMEGAVPFGQLQQRIEAILAQEGGE